MPTILGRKRKTSTNNFQIKNWIDTNRIHFFFLHGYTVGTTMYYRQ